MAQYHKTLRESIILLFPLAFLRTHLFFTDFFENGVEKLGILFFMGLPYTERVKLVGKCYKAVFSLSLSPLQWL